MSTTQEQPGQAGRVQAAPGLWRADLQRHELGLTGREMIQVRVEIEPTSPPIRQFHPGEEIIYVLEGWPEYQIDGQPTRTYRAGER
jgi:quercetin dioxygenase-like cupin family protein